MTHDDTRRATTLGAVRLRNFTPHEVVIVLEGGESIRIASEGAARVTERRRPVGAVGGVPVFAQSFGDVEGLPDALPGVIVIVSSIVLHAAGCRTDLVAPDTSAGAVRDDAGRVVGTRAFVVAGGAASRR
jgi:hypothetical protein